MEQGYVEQRDGGYWIKGTRISLDSVVYAFKRGAAPESIKRSFPLLSLEEIYGAITFYLAHEQQIDSYLEASEKEFDVRAKEMNEQARQNNPELFERLEKARNAKKVPTQDTDRMNFRLDPEIKARMARAAAITGQELTDFAVSTLSEKASEILERHDNITLDSRDYSFFMNALADDQIRPSEKSRGVRLKVRPRIRRGLDAAAANMMAIRHSPD
jgi:uncharacterized protein (DUF1778 family)/uncharacterized protein (DUF433 family)